MCSLLQCSSDPLFVPKVRSQDNQGSMMVVVVQDLAGGVELYGGHVGEVASTPPEQYKFGQAKFLDKCTISLNVLTKFVINMCVMCYGNCFVGCGWRWLDGVHVCRLWSWFVGWLRGLLGVVAGWWWFGL